MKYRATDRVRLQVGARVRVDEGQAQRRRHMLAAEAEDGYREVLVPFDFKVGEVFELDGDLPKNLAQPVVEGEGDAYAAEPAAKAEPRHPAAKATAKPKPAKG